jgi:hypothetical protein
MSVERISLASLEPGSIHRARTVNGDVLRAMDDLIEQSDGATDRECRVLEELRHAILEQREAVARGDTPSLDSSIRLAGRALLTLQENWGYRETLLRRLMDDAARSPGELDPRLEPALREAFLVARRRMQTLAAGVAEDVCRNQEVLLAALRERDALLLELLRGRGRP